MLFVGTVRFNLDPIADYDANAGPLSSKNKTKPFLEHKFFEERFEFVIVIRFVQFQFRSTPGKETIDSYWTALERVHLAEHVKSMYAKYFCIDTIKMTSLFLYS